MKPRLPPLPSSSPPLSPTSYPKLITQTTISLLLFSLGYTLGFLSSSSSCPPPFSSPSQSDSNSTIPYLSVDLFRFRTKCADPIPQSSILSTILNNSFDGASPFLGFPSPETSSLILPPRSNPRGWGSTGAVFRDLIESLRPSTIIELGSFLGASALHMAAVTRGLSLPTLILCIDDFRAWPGFRRRLRRDVPPSRWGDSLLLPQFMANVAAAGEASRVVPLPFSTAAALAALCDWGIYGDLIEVDAGHDFHSAWADINRAYAILRPGGVLFGHDYHTIADNRGVRRAVTLFAKVKGLQVRGHGEHWVLSAKPLNESLW
ncbi:uncharacterized protein [Typha latifolia]|uniref:uncharacterized protein n=1 Tax=Typha latifolia TaxID=4733 RepID=UPI003C2BA095